jgi:hypothetical protein
MSQTRHRRLPISCEPCRSRKIRCPRDSVPCGTCRRRGVPPSHCSFAQVPQAVAAPLSPISGGRSSAATSTTDENLADRVARLEGLLVAQQRQLSQSEQTYGQVQFMTPSSESRDYGQARRAPSQFEGVLQTSASGHVRFIPCWPAIEPEESHTSHHGQLERTSPFGSTYDTGGMQLNDLLSLLPPRTLCAKLKDVYFASFAPLFHILHDPTFYRQYSQFEADPTSVSLSWLALLFAVLSTAMTACDADTSFLSELTRQATLSDKIRDLSERYRAATLRCLHMDNYMWRHNVTTLQALIILIYGINHSHGQSWTLLGTTYHLSLSIGCHVDPSLFNLSLVESEERRRCWAGLNMLCTLQNSSLRNIAPHYNDVQYSVQLPADVDDMDLELPENRVMSNPGHATQMSYLLLKFRLYRIGSEICQKVLSNTRTDPQVIADLDETLVRQRRSWLDIYLRHSHDHPLPIHHKIHLEVLHSFSHQLTLLLHRPILVGDSTNSTLYEKARSRSFESAHVILKIHTSLYEMDEFQPFAWYNRGLGSFHAFHAAIVLIATVTNPADINNEYVDSLQSLRDCLTRFENMADLSSICRKAAPVMRRLL